MENESFCSDVLHRLEEVQVITPFMPISQDLYMIKSEVEPGPVPVAVTEMALRV